VKRLLLLGAGLIALTSPAFAAISISVEDIGSVFNESLALPAEDTPGSGIGFAEYFEFSLPSQETVTISAGDSAVGNERITGGVLALNNWETTGPAPLFIPTGSLIESSPLTNQIGGQSASVTPDVLSAGNYFAELSGISGSSPIHITVDGTITGTTVPEPKTWALMGVGFAFLSFIGIRRSKSARYAI
jgi:hypothetical protein